MKSYVETEEYENYIRNLSIEMVNTDQGCMPTMKTFEWNAYNKNKYVKTLKFYDFTGDCKLRKQIIVDEGIMH